MIVTPVSWRMKPYEVARLISKDPPLELDRYTSADFLIGWPKLCKARLAAHSLANSQPFIEDRRFVVAKKLPELTFSICSSSDRCLSCFSVITMCRDGAA